MSHDTTREAAVILHQKLQTLSLQRRMAKLKCCSKQAPSFSVVNAVYKKHYLHACSTAPVGSRHIGQTCMSTGFAHVQRPGLLFTVQILIIDTDQRQSFLSFSGFVLSSSHPRTDSLRQPGRLPALLGLPAQASKHLVWVCGAAAANINMFSQLQLLASLEQLVQQQTLATASCMSCSLCSAAQVLLGAVAQACMCCCL